MLQEKIDRINELARKAREGALSPEELAERDELRREYIASFRESLEAQLENTYTIDENGSRQKLKKRNNGPNPTH